MKSNVIRAIACLALLIPLYAAAGAFSISPVRVDLGPATPDTAITIQNDADRPLSIQVRAYEWGMKEGQDALTLTKDILVAPSIVTIAPHARQVIRAALRTEPDKSREKTYRMHFTEIPQPDPAEHRQVQMTLNITIPLFVTPTSARPAGVNPTWKASVAADGKVHLEMTNDSGWHLRLGNLAVKPGHSEEVLFSQPNSFYVLPETQNTWTFGSPRIPTDSLDISFDNEEKRMNLTIPLVK